MALSRAITLGCVVLMLMAGVSVQPASAALGLRWPVIPWYSILQGGYVDLITRQPITTQFTLANQGAVAPGSQAAWQQQPNQLGLLSQIPRATSRTLFPLTFPSLSFWEKCFKETDPLSALVTKCNYQDTFTTCQQLAAMGYLPKGVQSFEAPKLTGAFNIPTGCTAGSLGVSYDMLFRLTFNSPQIPVLAVISKDAVGSMVSYFGTGTTQGRVRHRLATKAEFCYSPSISDISVTKAAIYSTGMQPGTASWSFSKSAMLPAGYPSSRAVMIRGDTADVTWTVSAAKTGMDVNYQGVVSGTISINNPTPAVVTVNSIVDQVTNGPASTVSCPVGTPFTVPACSFASCSYTTYYPTAPPPGTYTSAAQVQFQVMGSMGYPSTAQGAATFNVGSVSSLSSLSTNLGNIPNGAAVVTDKDSPQGSFMFSGPGQQTYTTTLRCDKPTAGSAYTSAAVLTGSNGQQITQSATVQRECYDLGVTVTANPAPAVGSWAWTVNKVATPAVLSLKPSQSSYTGSGSFGQDYGETTTGDVVYTVTYTKSPPPGFSSSSSGFQAGGEVYVSNSAPGINAELKGVYVTITNGNGGRPFTAEANCPLLAVPSGQKITCTWSANPTFNPVGQQVYATARYINTHNLEKKAGTTDFNSAAVTIVGGQKQSRRRLQQTWTGANKAVTVGLLPELQPAVATTLYAVDGTPLVVPNSVANGTGIIVSGNALINGNLQAIASAQGMPVILPSNLGGFVNEAGPSNAASSALSSLTGIGDDCIDIADAFAEGSTAKGEYISGDKPDRRICETKTFTYTVRYGPYATCGPRKSVNAATFQAVDSSTRGVSQAEVSINVDGCSNPASLKFATKKVATSAKGGYMWSVTKRANQPELALAQGATAMVDYTVEYVRTGTKGSSTLAADVSVSNPSDYAVTIDGATYTATTMCNKQARTTNGPVTCTSFTVPRKGQVTCQIRADLPCTGSGAYTVMLSAGSQLVTSPPMTFDFDQKELATAVSNGQCADVRDVFLTGVGRVGGAVVSGVRPNGRLCGTMSVATNNAFVYTIKFGPFPSCGMFEAVNTATLSTNATTKTAASTYTLPITVVGCNKYATSATIRNPDCVQPASWWSGCDASSVEKCASGWDLLPGGLGKGTLFFAQPNQRSDRTYGLILQQSTTTTTDSRKAFAQAAREFVTAQLNFLSGARLPSADLQDAYDSLSAFLSTTSERTLMPPELVQAIQVQAGLLGRYNNGTLPASYKAPARC